VVTATLQNSSDAAALAKPSAPARTRQARTPWIALLTRGYALKTLSALTLIALWYIASSRLPPTIMPPPHVVLDVLWKEVTAGPIWFHVAITLKRIMIAFSLAMTVSLILGFAMGLSKTAELFLEVWVVTTMIVPSLVLILMIYMVAGLNDAAAVIGAAIPVVPIVTINLWEGIKGVDTKLVDMSRAYRAERLRVVRSVIAPQIAPTIFASARFGLGLVWKTVLFVELLGRSDGIGYQIEFYFQLFNMGEVLAHAVLFLVIMLMLEMGVLSAIEKRFFGWRAPRRSF
jgi:NitT/TauT family transport system permease protein